MNIWAVVVTYNGAKWIDRCVGSLVNSIRSVNILIVDNASQDNTKERIKTKYSQATLIELNENRGFAKANNVGIKYALEHDADYVFLLNQDAWIGNDTIEKLLDTFNHYEQIGIVSPIHLNGLSTALDSGFASYMSHEFISDAYLKKISDIYYIPFVNAAAWLISAECIRKVGGFDTSLFIHYGEDDNYCQRVLYHEYKIAVNTNCSICHDRESRDEKYVDLIWGSFNTELSQKMWMGNVNQEFDLKIIRSIKKRILMNILLLRPREVKNLRKKINLMRKIDYSRSVNKRGGLVWLEACGEEDSIEAEYQYNKCKRREIQQKI